MVVGIDDGWSDVLIPIALAKKYLSVFTLFAEVKRSCE